MMEGPLVVSVEYRGNRCGNYVLRLPSRARALELITKDIRLAGIIPSLIYEKKGSASARYLKLYASIGRSGEVKTKLTPVVKGPEKETT
jgi:hypothetical protein